MVWITCVQKEQYQPKNFSHKCFYKSWLVRFFVVCGMLPFNSSLKKEGPRFSTNVLLELLRVKIIDKMQGGSLSFREHSLLFKMTFLHM